MADILIAEDSATQAAQVRALLRAAGFEARVVGDGIEALAAMAQQPPLAVLTDLEMPNMNGLDLVVAARREYPHIPVLVMTAFGSEEVAVHALQAGAASYVPKKNLADSLINTLQDVLEVARARREDARLTTFLEGIDAKFDLPNLANQAMAVVGYVQESMAAVGLGDATDRLRLGVALDAAIQNAMYLGNLELEQRQLLDAQRHTDAGKAFARLIHERDSQPPYRDRKVHVSVQLTRSGINCVVGHEGPGFDAKAALEADENLELAQTRGGGWVLVKSLVGKLSFDANGNEVTLSR
jgi:CheY-like chemotaxis protein